MLILENKAEIKELYDQEETSLKEPNLLQKVISLR
jgi:hypothetical protein